MPSWLVPYLALVCGRILYLFGIRKNVVLKNLQIAFENIPSKIDSNAYYKEIAKKYYVHISTVFLEVILLKYLSIKKLNKIFITSNTQLFNRGNRGAIALSAHVGNWEMMATLSSLFLNEKVNLVVKAQKDFGLMNKVRTRFGSNIIDVGVSARRAVATIKRGEIIAFLADQSANQSDEVLTMFNKPTHAFTAVARLALKMKPLVIICFPNRQKDGTYLCNMTELKYDDINDDEEGVKEFTQRYLNALEANIYQYPEQWLWSHKRWKHNVNY